MNMDMDMDNNNEKVYPGETKGDESTNDELDIEILLIFSQPIKTLKIPNRHIQIFNYSDLLFNKIDHVFVPKHVLIKDSNEIQTLIQQYKLNSKWRFPVVLKSDPISKYYNAKRGDIFKVTRVSYNASTYVTYRCVV